jgi:6-pyruvoyltetrahydropterin/6-carboxytetrahydropterin synthase
LGEILINYDHTCINDVTPFDKINASSENIATTIYEQLKQKLEEFATALSGVQVWESPNSCVTYTP